MSATAVRDAFRVKLLELIPVGWQYKATIGKQARPQADEKWIALTFLGVDEQQASIDAARRYVETGVVVVRLFADRGDAAEAALETAAQTIRAGFRNWRHASLDLKVGAVDPPQDFTDAESAFAETQVGVPYRYAIYT